MFPLEISGRIPHTGMGRGIACIADAGGHRFYCKRDQHSKPTRATEWICTSLAKHLGILVPDFAVLIDPSTGETFFGSKEVWGTASTFDAQTYLTTPFDPITGDPTPWLAAYLSRLTVLDIFTGNIDRQICNFLLVSDGRSRRLLAFDFGESDLSQFSTTNFPIAQTQTMFVGRRFRAIRSFDMMSAQSAINELSAISPEIFESIIGPVPEDWLSRDNREKLVEHWRSGAHKVRLDALRRGLKDGSLL